MEIHFIRQWSLALFLALTSPLVSGRKCVQVCLSSLPRNNGNTVFGSAELGSSFPFCCGVHQLTVAHSHTRCLPPSHPHFSHPLSHTQSHSFLSFTVRSATLAHRQKEGSFRAVLQRESEAAVEEEEEERGRRWWMKDWPWFPSFRAPGSLGFSTSAWNPGRPRMLLLPRRPLAADSVSHSVSRLWNRHLLSP